MYGDHDETSREELEYITPIYRLAKSESEDVGKHHDHSISYENKFGTTDRKLSASLDLSFEEDEIVQYNMVNSSAIDELRTMSDTDVKEKNNSTTFRVDYEDELNEKIYIETGAKATLKSFSTDYNYLRQLYINDFIISWDINSIFWSEILDI